MNRASPSPVFTLDQAAERLYVKPDWLRRWLLEHPASHDGRPFFAPLGRTKTFDEEDITRLRVAIKNQIVSHAFRKFEARNDPGHIYFVEAGEFIKIGYTRSPDHRLHKMRTDLPFEIKVLHMHPGTFKQEKIFHRQFASTRVRGEWFRKTPELLALIERLARSA
jgi:hypothetical protein